MIDFLAEKVNLPHFIKEEIKDWIKSVIASYDYELGDLSYLFCDDDYIIEINRQYLQHDYYTDIITFDYCTGKVISGDLVISLDTVRSNSEMFNTSYETELKRVVIHGVLHLLGFKDSTVEEKDQMRAEENKALSLLSTFH
ncbi:rRNA maturation RNase YbeY [Carboxylicivirga marina]|uniref:Endoribonuclease YbeY n=1 Tax=Carboxylicivirga marina TaxID=2800988 RepID=A0ABS1HG20_9BACT|nr:rRNA maturation RNase YbeY [Carboxylicivirga marina]MBK3516597.1 rRNA maturation RNase YbeY [Carboxylicivirga marina]